MFCCHGVTASFNKLIFVRYKGRLIRTLLHLCIEVFHKHVVLVLLKIEEKHMEIFVKFSLIKVTKDLKYKFLETSQSRFII